MSETSGEWYGTSSPKYDREIHVPLLHEIFSNAEGVVAFCAAADISTKTFQNWCAKYPEFKEHYDRALAKGATIWEKKMLEMAERGISLNYNYWMAINRNRYRFCQNKVEREKEDTTSSRLQAAWNSLQNGGITAQEYNQIAAGLSAESKVKELEMQREIVDNLKESTTINKEMTDEAIKAFMLVKSGKGKVVENV